MSGRPLSRHRNAPHNQPPEPLDTENLYPGTYDRKGRRAFDPTVDEVAILHHRPRGQHAASQTLRATSPSTKRHSSASPVGARNHRARRLVREKGPSRRHGSEEGIVSGGMQSGAANITRKSILRHSISTDRPYDYLETINTCSSVSGSRSGSFNKRVRFLDQVKRKVVPSPELVNLVRSDSESSLTSGSSGNLLLSDGSLSSGTGSLGGERLGGEGLVDYSLDTSTNSSSHDITVSEGGGPASETKSGETTSQRTRCQYSSNDSDYSTENESLIYNLKKNGPQYSSQESFKSSAYSSSSSPTTGGIRVDPSRSREKSDSSLDDPPVARAQTVLPVKALNDSDDEQLSSESNSTLADSSSSDSEIVLPSGIIIKREKFTSGSEFESSPESDMSSKSDNSAGAHWLMTVMEHRASSPIEGASPEYGGVYEKEIDFKYKESKGKKKKTAGQSEETDEISPGYISDDVIAGEVETENLETRRQSMEATPPLSVAPQPTMIVESVSDPIMDDLPSIQVSTISDVSAAPPEFADKSEPSISFTNITPMDGSLTQTSLFNLPNLSTLNLNELGPIQSVTEKSSSSEGVHAPYDLVKQIMREKEDLRQLEEQSRVVRLVSYSATSLSSLDSAGTGSVTSLADMKQRKPSPPKSDSRSEYNSSTKVTTPLEMQKSLEKFSPSQEDALKEAPKLATFGTQTSTSSVILPNDFSSKNNQESSRVKNELQGISNVDGSSSNSEQMMVTTGTNPLNFASAQPVAVDPSEEMSGLKKSSDLGFSPSLSEEQKQVILSGDEREPSHFSSAKLEPAKPSSFASSSSLRKQLYRPASLDMNVQSSSPRTSHSENSPKPSTPTALSKHSPTTTISESSKATTPPESSPNTAMSKPSSKAPHSKTLSPQIDSEPATPANQSQPSSPSTHSKTPISSTHAKPSPFSNQSKPSTSSTHSKPSSLSNHSMSPSSTIHSKPSSSTIHSKPSTSTIHSKPSTSTIHSKPSLSSTHSKPITSSSKASFGEELRKAASVKTFAYKRTSDSSPMISKKGAGKFVIYESENDSDESEVCFHECSEVPQHHQLSIDILKSSPERRDHSSHSESSDISSEGHSRNTHTDHSADVSSDSDSIDLPMIAPEVVAAKECTPETERQTYDSHEQTLPRALEMMRSEVAKQTLEALHTGKGDVAPNTPVDSFPREEDVSDRTLGVLPMEKGDVPHHLLEDLQSGKDNAAQHSLKPFQEGKDGVAKCTLVKAMQIGRGDLAQQKLQPLPAEKGDVSHYTLDSPHEDGTAQQELEAKEGNASLAPLKPSELDTVSPIAASIFQVGEGGHKSRPSASDLYKTQTARVASKTTPHETSPTSEGIALIKEIARGADLRKDKPTSAKYHDAVDEQDDSGVSSSSKPTSRNISPSKDPRVTSQQDDLSDSSESVLSTNQRFTKGIFAQVGDVLLERKEDKSAITETRSTMDPRVIPQQIVYTDEEDVILERKEDKSAISETRSITGHIVNKETSMTKEDGESSTSTTSLNTSPVRDIIKDTKPTRSAKKQSNQQDIVSESSESVSSDSTASKSTASKSTSIQSTDQRLAERIFDEVGDMILQWKEEPSDTSEMSSTTGHIVHSSDFLEETYDSHSKHGERIIPSTGDKEAAESPLQTTSKSGTAWQSHGSGAAGGVDQVDKYLLYLRDRGVSRSSAEEEEREDENGQEKQVEEKEEYEESEDGNEQSEDTAPRSTFEQLHREMEEMMRRSPSKAPTTSSTLARVASIRNSESLERQSSDNTRSASSSTTTSSTSSSSSTSGTKRKVPLPKSYGSTGCNGGMPRLASLSQAEMSDEERSGSSDDIRHPLSGSRRRKRQEKEEEALVEYDNTSDFSSLAEEEEEREGKEQLQYSLRLESLDHTTTTCSCSPARQEDEDEITDSSKGRWADDYGVLRALKWIFCPCRDG